MDINIRNAEEHAFSQIIGLIKEFAAYTKTSEKMINTVEQMITEKEFFNCFVAQTVDKEIIGYASYFYCYYTWI